MQASKYFAAAILLPSLLSIHSTAAAEEATNPAVIVTATRTAQTVDDTLASVSVITRQEIEASQSDNLMELLQGRVAGLDFSRSGGPGSTTSIYVRGSEGDHVLVLVDGVRAASVTSGSFNWAGISPQQIERIEIVRGPNSTLYGSEAIGGVIQIFTRKESKLHAAVGGGRYGSAQASVGGGGQIGNGSYHLNLSREQNDGFSNTNKDSSNYEADNDGYHSNSINAGVSLPLNDTTQLSLNLLHNDSRTEYDNAGYSHAYATTVDNSGELHLDWQTRDDWSQRLVLNASDERYQSHDSYPTVINSRRRSANWQHDLTLSPESLFTLGIDLQQDNGVIDGAYDESIDNHAAYLQYQWHGELYDLLFGARGDDHSMYGQHNTGRLTLGRRVSEGRAYATIATAFKAPTFNELYYPFYGNPNIKPEESATAEVGYRLHGLQASVYQTNLTNMIQYDTATSKAINIGRAKLKGVELTYRHNIGQWQLEGAFTLQKTEDLDSGKQLVRRAEKKLLFNAQGPLDDNTSIGIEASYTGPRTDLGDVELAAFTLLNLTGEYRLNKQWVLHGRIENLLDEQYTLANGYNTAGASAYLTLSYQQ